MEATSTLYHKRRKKGAKKNLERRKKHNNENVPPPPPPPPVPPVPPVPAPPFPPPPPPPLLSQCTLPNHWQAHTTDDRTQYIKIGPSIGEMCQVSSSIAIHQDGTWISFFMGKEILPSNELLTIFPQIITPSTLQSLIVAIDNAFLCPGNPDKNLIGICKGRKDEKMSGNRGFGQTIAFIDDRDSLCKNHATLL